MAIERRPKGREEIIDALVDAARRLFSVRGPAAVSLREVAAEAGVNYGLVYQYIGTRDDLIRTVYRRLSEQSAASLAGTADLSEALGFLRRNESGDAYARMLAWTLLEGHDPREFLGRSAAMAEVVARARAALEGDAEDAELLTAVAMTVNLGAQVFADFFAVAVGLDAGAGAVQEAVDRLLARLPELIARPATVETPPPF